VCCGRCQLSPVNCEKPILVLAYYDGAAALSSLIIERGINKEIKRIWTQRGESN